MSRAWIITMGKEHAACLAGLRLEASLEVAEAGDTIWVRGFMGPSSDALSRKLATLPARDRYECSEDGELKRVGERVPAGKLQPLRWQPISEWNQVTVPVALPPAERPESIPLRLVPGCDEKQPGMLLTELKTLAAFAKDAPSIRLKVLEYAVHQEGWVLVRGNPLPPLPGLNYVLEQGVAIPAGMTWEPAVSADVMARVIAVPSGGGGIALWNMDGTVTQILGEQFLPVTRSGVLATLAKEETST